MIYQWNGLSLRVEFYHGYNTQMTATNTDTGEMVAYDMRRENNEEWVLNRLLPEAFEYFGRA